MAVAIKKSEIDAAITAATIPAADAAGIWPAALAARDGAPRGTRNEDRRALAVLAATNEVASKAPAKLAAFTAALTATAATPAPTTPRGTTGAPAATGGAATGTAGATAATAAATPAPTPAPTAVPAQYADAVEQALYAAGVPKADHPERGGAFADAMALNRGLDEALTRLFRGLPADKIEAGRKRFAGLTEPKWKSGRDKFAGLFTTWLGRLQLGLILVAIILLWNTSVPEKGWLVFVGLLVAAANLWWSDRKVLITLNLMFIIMIIMVVLTGEAPQDFKFK